MLKENFYIQTGEADRPHGFPLSMYEISGHNAITKRSIERYKNDKQQNEKIQKLAETSPLGYIKRIEECADYQERKSLIIECLRSPDPKIQLTGVHMFPYIKQVERADTYQTIRELITKNLASHDIEIQKIGAEMIHTVNEEDKEKFIAICLESPYQEVQMLGAKIIDGMYPSGIESLIKQCLTSSTLEVQIMGAQAIPRTRDPIKKELQSLLRTIVKNKLSSPAPENQKQARSLQKFLPNRPRAETKTTNPENIENDIAEIKQKIATIQDNKQKKILTEECLALIKLLPENIRTQYYNSFVSELDQHTVQLLISPPLYDFDSMRVKKKTLFPQHSFTKTGSETTVIAGDLQGKTIIRHLDPEAFLSWQKLYDSPAVWQAADFDYVPIEPIAHYTLDEEKKLVDVYSGVLDINFSAWQEKSNQFKTELSAERDRIKKVLKDLHVEHGHDYHDRNFCLRFFRDNNGNIDLTKKPRIYLIDFDRAQS